MSVPPSHIPSDAGSRNYLRMLRFSSFYARTSSTELQRRSHLSKKCDS
jgi:hypothetical protein